MAQTGFTPIQLYRTSTAAAAPTSGNLSDGELAINTLDEKLYFKNSAGTVKVIASTAGAAGDVAGPASAVDSSLAAFDGTTGKLIKNASLTANNVLLGNGTGAPLAVAPGANGNLLTSNGTTWTSSAPAAQVYPGAGIANSTGSAWGTSYTTTGSGTVVALATNPTITNYTETPYSANSSTAITLSLANGTVQIITLTGNATITMPTAVSGKSFIMFLRQDATGSRTVTWATVNWAGGTAPTVTSTASKQDIYSFFSDGTSWYGVNGGQNYTQ